MKKEQKVQIEKLINTIFEAHGQIKKYIEQRNFIAALDILEECQKAAILVGNKIESSEGEEFVTVQRLQEYCEIVFRIYEKLSQSGDVKNINSIQVFKNLKKSLIAVENSVKTDIQIETEIVFLPYKAAMWDSMESVWMAAEEDPSCKPYVIPIPYFDKNSDGSLNKMHYEGGRFPVYVPITKYDEFDLKEHHPEIIVIHNPYDEYNLVTCIHPFFFSGNLKKYTKKLVYIPYYVVPGKLPEHFILNSGVVNADLIFVQSDFIRMQYIDVLGKNKFYQKGHLLEEKIISMGSPKTDKILSFQIDKNELPQEWKQRVKGKKVIFFNTNVNLMLQNNEYFIQNLFRIFHIFEEYQNDFVLLWREHPLTIETLDSMRPGLKNDYLNLRLEFQEKQWGILDTMPDPHFAMALSDGYFGSGGSLVTIYSVTGKPMMITAYQYPVGISKKEITKEELYSSIGKRTYYKEEHANSLRLFLNNFKEIYTFKEHRLNVISKCLKHLDGSVGKNIYHCIMNKGETV